MQYDDKRHLYEKSIKYGALREIEAIKIFVERGYTVSVPTMSERYDFIAEKYPIILRVQVKPLRPTKKTENNAPSDIEWCIRPWSAAKGKRKPYCIEDCNIVMGIAVDVSGEIVYVSNKIIYAIVPIYEIENKAVEYKLTNYKNRNRTQYLNPDNEHFDYICAQFTDSSRVFYESFPNYGSETLEEYRKRTSVERAVTQRNHEHIYNHIKESEKVEYDKMKNPTIQDRWATDDEPRVYTEKEWQDKINSMTERQKQMAEEDPAVSVRTMEQYKKEQADYKRRMEQRRKKVAENIKEAE